MVSDSASALRSRVMFMTGEARPKCVVESSRTRVSKKGEALSCAYSRAAARARSSLVQIRRLKGFSLQLM